ncbi:MAG: 6-phosphofructokinase, partial [Halofilum sp. (in: g-proteobacteria)]
MDRQGKLLMVFDGGLAPGYTAVAVAMTEYAESRGYRVWAAREGFRSLAGASIEPSRVEPLTSEPGLAAGASVEEAVARNLYGHIRDAGSPFRSERFHGFHEDEAQREAARFILDEGFGTCVFVGGNGTLQGAKSLASSLEPHVHVGFINASVDSDLRGDRSVGFLTALEEGARVARGLFADAMTHHRHYILEMMGNRGGKHALHCGIAARAHLIVLPQMDLPADTMDEIAAQLNRRNHSLTVVAEGYCKDRRPEEQSAADYLRECLAEHGFADRKDRRVIAEPYSRYIRGVRPLAMENEGILLKCGLLLDSFERGASQIMPYYLSPHEIGVRRLDEVYTDNTVEPEYLDLIDRFNLESLRT